MRRGSRGARTARLDGPAKLTGMVNIAVFAAFWPCDRGGLLSNAAFKRVCRLRELDVSCYGRQKRQDPARKWQRMARWMAKTATFLVSGDIHATRGAVACGREWRVRGCMRLFKVPA